MTGTFRVLFGAGGVGVESLAHSGCPPGLVGLGVVVHPLLEPLELDGKGGGAGAVGVLGGVLAGIIWLELVLFHLI